MYKFAPMKKIFTTLSLSALFFCSSVAQNNQVQQPVRKCASPKVNPSYEEYFQQMMLKHQQFANARTTSTIYTIPIVFHIIHSGVAVNSTSATTGRNLNAAQINSQIAILNEDYRKTNSNFSTYVTQAGLSSIAADVEINFCAAKVDPTGAVMAEPGIDRISTVAKGWNSLPYATAYIESTVKPGSSWDPTKYFNVWVLEFGGSDLGTLGYAQFPTIPSGTTPITDMVGQGGAANTDGVVIDYHYIGNTGTALNASSAPYNKGRTLTHESGHWLGLWHIWGDDSNCSGSDYVADTPNQKTENYTCPTTAGAVVTDQCTATSPGVNYQNYMDYSDDKCMAMFTAGQKARMQAVMANCVRRLSLATSTVCSVTGIEETVSNVEMSVYPNPTNGELFVDVTTLDAQDFTISVVNTLGQTVKEVKQVQSNGGKIKIDLSDKNNGVYFVTLKSKAGSKVKRIVLQ